MLITEAWPNNLLDEMNTTVISVQSTSAKFRTISRAVLLLSIWTRKWDARGLLKLFWGPIFLMLPPQNAMGGLTDRAIPTGEIDAFVDTLARHVASLPSGIVAAAKYAIPAENLSESFKRESEAWFGLVTLPVAAKLIGAGMANGLQTKTGELQLEAILPSQLETY